MVELIRSCIHHPAGAKLFGDVRPNEKERSSPNHYSDDPRLHRKWHWCCRWPWDRPSWRTIAWVTSYNVHMGGDVHAWCDNNPVVQIILAVLFFIEHGCVVVNEAEGINRR